MMTDWTPKNAHEEAEDVKPNGHDIDPAFPLEILDFTTLHGKDVPEQRWLVPDWIPWDRVTGLFGAGGEGKTLLAQQLMTTAALKRHWLGRAVVPVRTLGLFCEDDAEELHRRQANINRLYGCEFADLDNMRALPRLGCKRAAVRITKHAAGTASIAVNWVIDIVRFGL